MIAAEEETEMEAPAEEEEDGGRTPFLSDLFCSRTSSAVRKEGLP